MLLDDLKNLGLSPNESQVYLALLDLGRARAGEVIKKIGLHRNLVYQALESLVDRRMVTKTTQAGVFHFQATDPEHFRDEVHSREVIASRVIEQLKERSKLTEQEITIYEGEDAIRTFSLKNAKRLQHGECIYVLGSSGKKFEAAMGEPALTDYFSEIGKHGGIKILMYRKQPYSSDVLKTLQKKRVADIRFLPFDTNPSAYVVFTNQSVAFHIYEQPLTVIEISNPHLVAAYKNYFEILWNQNVRVETGIDALRDAFTDMIDELAPGESYAVLGGNLGPEYRRMSAFFDEIHRYRISRGVVANILAQSGASSDIRERNRRVGDPDEKISNVKTFHTPFLAPMQINMVNGRAYMVLYKKDAPTVIYFDDKAVYDGFKLYFDEIWNRQVETLHGHDGIIQLCERVLEEGKDWYLIAAQGQIIKTHPEYYPDFTKRRLQKKIPLHILAIEEARGNAIMSNIATDIRFLPNAFASPMVVWVFGDYVANVLWHEPETVFLIHDAQTANYYRQYYEALSRMSKA